MLHAGAVAEKSSHVSFTLTVAGARVALHLRRAGEKLLVIVVCSARHAALVRRALADVADSLRAQGECVDASVRTMEEQV
jgi:hypothetical protein